MSNTISLSHGDSCPLTLTGWGILLEQGLLILLGHLSVYACVCVVRINQLCHLFVLRFLIATLVYSNCSGVVVSACK